MMLLMCQSDEDSTEHGEHISLDEGNQQLQTVHEQQHDDTEDIQAHTETDTH